MLVEHVTKIGAYFIFFSFILCLSFMFYVIVCIFFLSHCVLFFCLVAYARERHLLSSEYHNAIFSQYSQKHIF